MAAKFFTKLSNDLTNLLETGEDHDVIIEIGQRPNHQTFKAHSIILNSRCPYFRDKLIKNENNSIKNFKDSNISTVDFKTIIRYIYGGIVTFEKVNASTLLNLLTTANEFGLEELTNHVQLQLVKDHASWIRLHFFQIHNLSFENDCFEILQQFCNNIIAKYPNILFDSEDFITLRENALVSLLKLDNLQIDEGKIWDQVVRWGIAQNPELNSNTDPTQWSDEKLLSLKTVLNNCLPHIRYFQITDDDIMKKIYPYHRILEPNLWKDIMTKFEDPNKDKAITSTILPPRVISDTVLPPRNTFATTSNQIAGTPTGNNICTVFASNAEIQSWILAKGYNPKTFNYNLPHARFFIIKSCTGDDIHKSIKYDIWASTEIGNRRLDKAFCDNANKGPIYLFFSIIASGYFCGMAEMLTPVDYTTSATVWAQDKWKGVIKVKWIFIKDIPNNQLSHIKLVNNENKPVTYSRDTQELYPEPGCEMLKIFFDYRSRSSILDKFEFYDKREVEMRKDKIALLRPANPGVVITNH